MSAIVILNCPNGHVTQTTDLEKYGFNEYTSLGRQEGRFKCDQCDTNAEHYYVQLQFVAKIIATCSCGEVTESEPIAGTNDPSKPCKNSKAGA